MRRIEEIEFKAFQPSESPSLFSNLTASFQNVAHSVVDAVTTSTPLVTNYLTILQYHHSLPSRLNLWQTIKNAVPVSTSYIIGGIATWTYVGASISAAHNQFEAAMNVVSSIILNGFVNGFFFNEVIGPLWNKYVNEIPADVKKALDELQNKRPGQTGKLLRALSTTPYLLIFILAILSAYPFMALDTSQSNDPLWIAVLILISATMLQYKGVETVIFKAIPAVYGFFKNNFNYYFNKKQYQFDVLVSDIDKLRLAHAALLENGHEEFLNLLQINNQTRLQQTYDLLDDKNPSFKRCLQLLLQICEMGQQLKKHSPNRKILKAVQFVSLILTTASLPGYFLNTEQSAAEFFSIADPKLEFVLGFGIYFMTVALSYDVSWEVFASLYQRFSYAMNGVRSSWANSSGLIDFLSTVLSGVTNRKSWHTIIQLPLAIQQSPAYMLSALGFFYGISYWSVNISLYLNEQQLGKQVADILYLPTVIAVLAFNLFPVVPVTASTQQFYIKVRGNNEEVIQLNLEEYILRLQSVLLSLDSKKFLEMLKQITELRLSVNELPPEFAHEKIPEEYQEQLLEIFNKRFKEKFLETLLGGTPGDVLGEKHVLAGKTWCEVIPFLSGQYEHYLVKVSSTRFAFFHPKYNKLINEEQLTYGTFNHLNFSVQ